MLKFWFFLAGLSCLAQTETATAGGSLTGKVVDSVSGQGVRRAQVTAFPTGPAPGVSMNMPPSGGRVAVSVRPMPSVGNFQQPSPHQTIASEEGVFRFTGLPPGRYVIRAEKSGYVAEMPGMQRARRPETHDVVAGKETQGAELKLLKQAVITGRVLDADGEPVERAMVQAIPSSRMQLNPMSNAQTDDRGEFRISRLAAGTYKLLAFRQVFGPFGTQGQQKTVDAPTYHPSALDAATAADIRVGVGEERSGADIRIQKATAVRVTGRVTGQPKDVQVHVSLQPPISNMGRSGMLQGMMFGAQVSNAQADAEGRFTLYNVRPGEYNLTAQVHRQQSGALFATQRIRVGTADVDEVSIALHPMMRIEGKVRAEGDVPLPSTTNLYIQVQPVEIGSMGGSGGQVKEDGTFVIENLTRAKMHLQSNAPKGWYLKAISFGNQRLPTLEMDLSTGEAPLELIYSNKPGIVEGSVEGLGESAGAMVMLVPEIGGSPMGRASQVKTAPVEPGRNRFRFEDVRPGRYRAFAGEPWLMQLLMDPQSAEGLLSKGLEVNVGEGVTASATPRLILEKDVEAN